MQGHKMHDGELPAMAAGHEGHGGGMLDGLRDTLCGSCGLKKPSGPPHLTIAYFQVPDGTPASEGLVSAIARYRDWPVGDFAVESVEMTLLDLRLDYPEPEILAEIPLKKASQPVSLSVNEKRKDSGCRSDG